MISPFIRLLYTAYDYQMQFSMKLTIFTFTNPQIFPPIGHSPVVLNKALLPIHRTLPDPLSPFLTPFFLVGSNHLKRQMRLHPLSLIVIFVDLLRHCSRLQSLSYNRQSSRCGKDQQFWGSHRIHILIFNLRVFIASVLATQFLSNKGRLLQGVPTAWNQLGPSSASMQGHPTKNGQNANSNSWDDTGFRKALE